MSLGYRFRRAWLSVTTEGPAVFTRKLIRFIPWVFRRMHYKLNTYLPEFLKRHDAMGNEEYAFLSTPIFQITSDDIVKSKLTKQQPKPKHIKSATWFVP